MGDTNIPYVHKSWNPWHGCLKVSPGCDNCYMHRDKKRFGHDPNNVVRSSSQKFYEPKKWNEEERVLTCSWTDFFIEDADDWRHEAWNVIRDCPHLTFLILTKRPENILNRLPIFWPLHNVWFGITAENQTTYDQRVYYLQRFQNTNLCFVSAEPLLSDIDLRLRFMTWISWVIVGAESGPNSRFMQTCWADSIMSQCFEFDRYFYMKQMPHKQPIPKHLNIRGIPGGTKT